MYIYVRGILHFGAILHSQENTYMYVASHMMLDAVT